MLCGSLRKKGRAIVVGEIKWPTIMKRTGPFVFEFINVFQEKRN